MSSFLGLGNDTGLLKARKTSDPRSAAEMKIKRHRDIFQVVNESVKNLHTAFQTIQKHQKQLLQCLEELLFDGCAQNCADLVSDFGSFYSFCANDDETRKALNQLEFVEKKSTKVLNELEDSLYLFEQRDIAWGQQQHYEKKVYELRAGQTATSATTSKVLRNEQKLNAARIDATELQEQCRLQVEAWNVEIATAGELDDWLFRGVKTGIVGLCSRWGQAATGVQNNSKAASPTIKPVAQVAAKAQGTSVATGIPVVVANKKAAAPVGTTVAASSSSFSPTKAAQQTTPAKATTAGTAASKATPSFSPSVREKTGKKSDIKERNSTSVATVPGVYPNNFPSAASPSSVAANAASSAYPTHIGGKVEVLHRPSSKSLLQTPGRKSDSGESPSSASTSPKAGLAGSSTQVGAVERGFSREVVDQGGMGAPPRDATAVAPQPNLVAPERTATRQDNLTEVVSQTPQEPAEENPPDIEHYLSTRAQLNQLDALAPKLFKDDEDAEQEISISLAAPMVSRISRVSLAGQDLQIVRSTNQQVTIRGSIPLTLDKHPDVIPLKELCKKRLPLRIESFGIEHFCFRSDVELDVYTHLQFSQNCGLNLIFPDAETEEGRSPRPTAELNDPNPILPEQDAVGTTEANSCTNMGPSKYEIVERKQGSMDAVCFAENAVDYYEIEILEVIPRGQTRTAAFGFFWELPTQKLARIGKNSQELRNSVVIGGELPQIHLDGVSIKRNLEWRPRKVLQEKDRVGVRWLWAEATIQVFHNSELVVERVLDGAIRGKKELFPLVDCAGNVRKLRFVQAAKPPRRKKRGAGCGEDDDENSVSSEDS
ncbi:unnamed protein product [Amoebophrya sp. A120]|nr:unnamed protein product [Amoebophrya sp. A120]|eukprot:GSA120T00004221001.1